MSEGVELQVAGHTVTVTSPDKVFFQARGDTKLDLIEYYLSIGDAVMRQMYDRPVLLVTDGQEQLAPSIRALVRTGYDDIWGHLQGGMVAWHAATLPTSSFPVWSASAIGERKDGDLFYLDIRMGKEWNEVRAPDAHHIFVGHLPSRIDEVPGDRDIVILCSTGMRGSLAASILKARGRSPINLLGGLTGWMRAGLPISYISM